MAIKLLFIETSSDVCSVALSDGATIVDEIFISESKLQAKMIGTLITELLERNRLSIKGCDAVVVSEGPGSYTGLRVGVSIAKGLCYGAGIPLISVSSLQLLANLALSEYHKSICNNIVSDGGEELDNFLIIPMIDAMRMEVYAAIFSATARQLSKTTAVILDQFSFEKELKSQRVIFAGNGAEKASKVIESPNALFMSIDLLASGMLQTALERYHNNLFEDVAYFEPAYLKEFVAGVSKKSLLL